MKITSPRHCPVCETVHLRPVLCDACRAHGWRKAAKEPVYVRDVPHEEVQARCEAVRALWAGKVTP